jgi:hypothetical protein
MTHTYEYSFNRKLSTAITTQTIRLPDDIESVENVIMLDKETGEIFEVDDYIKAFSTNEKSMFGSFQFSIEKLYYATERNLFIRFHTPKFNYTHAIIVFKSKVFDRQVKCEFLLA